MAGNEAKEDLAGGKVAGKGTGIFQAGTFELSDDAVVSVENDVYLPSGRIIDVVDAFDGATRACPVSITSGSRGRARWGLRPGTKLVRYHDAAGGVDAARRRIVTSCSCRARRCSRSIPRSTSARAPMPTSLIS